MADVAVIGAGIIGITTALSVLEKDPTLKVTIFADEFSPNTTSDGAAGLILPSHTGGTPMQLQRKWVAKTFKVIQRLFNSEQAPQYGVSLMTGFDVWDKVIEDPPLQGLVLSHRRMSEKELKDFPVQPASYGLCYTTFVVEGRSLIPCLMQKIKSLGGTFVQRHVTSLTELSDYDVVVNCTDIGARELVGDMSLKPGRGQVLRIKAPWIKCTYAYFAEEENKLGQRSYIIPQIDSVVVGGTFQIDNYNTRSTLEDTEKIMSGVSRLIPSIKNATVLQNWAGLRPTRKCVRLERENMKWTDTRGQENALSIIHNYGHGGAGITLSFGCADDCSDLVLKEVANKRKAKL